MYAVQSVRSLPSIRGEALGSIPSTTQTDLQLQSQHLEVEPGESEVQGHTQLHSEFVSSVGFMRHCLDRQKTHGGDCAGL